MGILPQLITALLIWLVIIGTFLSPELKAYAAQLIALLLLFYIVFMHMAKQWKKQEQKEGAHEEDTLLFLSTFVKPKLEHMQELVEHEENRPLVEKQLDVLEHEIEAYLEEQEHAN